MTNCVVRRNFRVLLDWSLVALDDCNDKRVEHVCTALVETCAVALFRVRESGATTPSLTMLRLCQDVCSELHGSLRCEARSECGIRCENRCKPSFHEHTHRVMPDQSKRRAWWRVSGLFSSSTVKAWPGEAVVGKALVDVLVRHDELAQRGTQSAVGQLATEFHNDRRRRLVKLWKSVGNNAAEVALGRCNAECRGCMLAVSVQTFRCGHHLCLRCCDELCRTVSDENGANVRVCVMCGDENGDGGGVAVPQLAENEYRFEANAKSGFVLVLESPQSVLWSLAKYDLFELVIVCVKDAAEMGVALSCLVSQHVYEPADLLNASPFGLPLKPHPRGRRVVLLLGRAILRNYLPRVWRDDSRATFGASASVAEYVAFCANELPVGVDVQLIALTSSSSGHASAPSTPPTAARSAANSNKVVDAVSMQSLMRCIVQQFTWNSSHVAVSMAARLSPLYLQRGVLQALLRHKFEPWSLRYPLANMAASGSVVQFEEASKRLRLCDPPNESSRPCIIYGSNTQQEQFPLLT